MRLQETVRKTHKYKTYLQKVMESRALNAYVRIVTKHIVDGNRFDFPNGFGSVAIIEKEYSKRGKRQGHFGKLKELAYIGPITEGEIIVCKQASMVKTALKKSNKRYRSQLVSYEH